MALFLAFGIGYSLVVPPFETPDEPFHYGFARHIAQGNGLPVQSAEETGPWAQEGSQAPLYYLLTGWLTRGSTRATLPRSPCATRAPTSATRSTPATRTSCSTAGRWQPLSGQQPGAAHGALVVAAAGGGRRCDALVYVAAGCAGLVPGRVALPLLATALVAAIPQFLFISASFSNDTLVMAAARRPSTGWRGCWPSRTAPAGAPVGVGRAGRGCWGWRR